MCEPPEGVLSSETGAERSLLEGIVDRCWLHEHVTQHDTKSSNHHLWLHQSTWSLTRTNLTYTVSKKIRAKTDWNAIFLPLNSSVKNRVWSPLFTSPANEPSVSAEAPTYLNWLISADTQEAKSVKGWKVDAQLLNIYPTMWNGYYVNIYLRMQNG